VCLLRGRTGSLYIIQVMGFVWIWELTSIISLRSINGLVFITETECVNCAVRTGSLYIIQVMGFVWIWEQTAFISLHSINGLVFITETECVYCTVRTGSASIYPFILLSFSVRCEAVGLYSGDGRLEFQPLNGLPSVSGSVSLFKGTGGIMPRVEWSVFVSHFAHLILH
jgi:hypothetical protein